MENNLLNKINYPEPDLVHCPYKRCKIYGEILDCYFDLYKNCERYLKWKNAVELYKRQKLQAQYLKRKKY